METQLMHEHQGVHQGEVTTLQTKVDMESTMGSAMASSVGQSGVLSIQGASPRRRDARPSLTFFPKTCQTGRPSLSGPLLDQWIPAMFGVADKPRLSTSVIEMPTRFKLIEGFCIVDLDHTDDATQSSISSPMSNPHSLPALMHFWPSSLASSSLAHRCREMCCSYAEYQKSDWFIFAFLESSLREVSIFQGSANLDVHIFMVVLLWMIEKLLFSSLRSHCLKCSSQYLELFLK